MTTPREDLAARLVVGLAGPRLDPAEGAWLARWRPAGVILFARNVTGPEQLQRLTGELHALLPPEAEIMADHEGGAVSFLQAAAGRPPAPRTLGELDDPELTRRVHRETGTRLLALGIDRVLAPCCDVLTEPRNPVIGARAFAADSAGAARHAAAAAAGLVEAGLRGCAKHWPGHGAAVRDTHHGAAGGSAARDQAPFEAALAAGLDAVMVGHLPVGAGRPPLTVDREGLAALRERLGGRLLLSDDVSMGALREPLAARGIAAGDGRSEGLIDPAVLPLAWLEAVAGAGCERILLRGVPWGAFPVDVPQPPPPLPTEPPPLDLNDPGPDAPAYAEARRRVARSLPRIAAGERVLWLDLTPGDRLGEAAALAPLLTRIWPGIVRLDATAPRLAVQRPFGALVVTGHRPLSVAAARLLEPLAAAVGTGLTLGHPSLAGDLARLLGPGWRLGACHDLSAADLAPLVGAR